MIFQQNEYLGRFPIHFAIESLCSENIIELAKPPIVNLDVKYTPLTLLARRMRNENFENLQKGFRFLIDHGANVNLRNSEDKTPLDVVLDSNNEVLSDECKQKVIEDILSARSIDLNDDILKEKLIKRFPNLQLPSQRMTTIHEWNFIELMETLNEKNENEFIYGFDKFIENRSESEVKQLLRTRMGATTLFLLAVENNFLNAIEKMLRHGATINYSGLSKCTSPISKALHPEYEAVIDLFFMIPNLLEDDFIAIFDSMLFYMKETVRLRKNNENLRFYREMYKKMFGHPRFNVNIRDCDGDSLLWHAITFDISDIIYDLLEKGAYIGTVNKTGQIAIDLIRPEILESHFNKCITVNDYKILMNKRIIFDYKNFVPTSNEGRDVCEGSCNGVNSGCGEMTAFEIISKSTDLRHLIKHPLMASFIILKWQCIKSIFCIHFFINSIFSVCIVTYLLLFYTKALDHYPPEAEIFLFSISVISLAMILWREFYLCCLSPKLYFIGKNYFEIFLIVLVSIALLNAKGAFDLSFKIRKCLSAIIILLISATFFNSNGSLPYQTFSIHVTMIKEVSKSFLKSFCLFAIILTSFSFCFYILLSNNDATNSGHGDCMSNATNGCKVYHKNDKIRSDLSKFNSPFSSIVKTIVMMTGEFEAASINFDTHQFSYIVFLFFVLFVSTILFNLLNGLAVNDIQVSEKPPSKAKKKIDF